MTDNERLNVALAKLAVLKLYQIIKKDIYTWEVTYTKDRRQCLASVLRSYADCLDSSFASDTSDYQNIMSYSYKMARSVYAVSEINNRLEV